MKKSRKKIKTQPEDLKFENEFRKAKLQLEKGAIIRSEQNLPPEIESLFLDQIEKFDRAYKKAKRISVYEKLGKPKFKTTTEIPAKKVKTELNLLLKKMAKKGLIVESICKVDEKEMYRFITEELFKHEIDDISIKGMALHFIYEEFHPNHEYDVKRDTEDFVKEILSDTEKIQDFLLAKEFKNSEGKIISSEKVVEKINFIRSFYSKFDLEKFEILAVKINDEKTFAEIIFDIKFIATLDNSTQKQTFAGTGKSALKIFDKWWAIYQFEMPGFII